MQDAAILVVFHLIGGIHTAQHLGLHRGPIGAGDDNIHHHARRELFHAQDVNHLIARQAKALAAFAFLEHQRQHAHANQV